MPHVYTMDGATKRNPRCKRVTNKRTGCSTLLCYTGRGRTGWQFKKGSTRCPNKRSK